jgi:hypothetical protein
VSCPTHELLRLAMVVFNCLSKKKNEAGIPEDESTFG